MRGWACTVGALMAHTHRERGKPKGTKGRSSRSRSARYCTHLPPLPPTQAAAAPPHHQPPTTPTFIPFLIHVHLKLQHHVRHVVVLPQPRVPGSHGGIPAWRGGGSVGGLGGGGLAERACATMSGSTRMQAPGSSSSRTRAVARPPREDGVCGHGAASGARRCWCRLLLRPCAAASASSCCPARRGPAVCTPPPPLADPMAMFLGAGSSQR